MMSCFTPCWLMPSNTPSALCGPSPDSWACSWLSSWQSLTASLAYCVLLLGSLAIYQWRLSQQCPDNLWCDLLSSLAPAHGKIYSQPQTTISHLLDVPGERSTPLSPKLLTNPSDLTWGLTELCLTFKDTLKRIWKPWWKCWRATRRTLWRQRRLRRRTWNRSILPGTQSRSWCVRLGAWVWLCADERTVAKASLSLEVSQEFWPLQAHLHGTHRSRSSDEKEMGLGHRFRSVFTFPLQNK
jgi:hypothetical protein